MTDEQFHQLMSKLDQIQRSLPQPNYIGHPGSVGSPGCLNCGSFHGGLMCPRLSPSAIGYSRGVA